MSKQTKQSKDLTKMVKDNAQQIYLAGLGAVAKAQAEGAKVFDGLVKDGEKLEAQLRKDAGSVVTKLREGLEKNVSDTKSRATSSVDKLEGLFQNRVSRALAALRIPSREDIEALNARIEKLVVEVKALANEKSTSAPTSKAPAKSAKKAAA